jgi:hypothetical protein
MIHPSEPLDVRLPAATWNIVGQALAKLPYETAEPIISEVNRQLGEAIAKLQPAEDVNAT